MPNAQRAASTLDWCKTLLLYPLPHHPISRLIGRLARVRRRWFKNALIRGFARWYRVDLTEAREPDPDAYPHFNAFFTRALAANARPSPAHEADVACPADGTISQIGSLENNRVFQAKGRWYGLTELLGDAALAHQLANGVFATIYLAPRDYHRVHMPIAGHLQGMTHIPGRLFSVAPHTVRAVPRLFARNERVVAAFETANGPLAVVLVGAVCVASIETVWHGVVTPPRQPRPQSWSYADEHPHFQRGDEIGRFNMGSTAILIMGRDQASWYSEHQPGDPIRMGQALGSLTGSGA
jgi:phosphatidylserine decarboxylase